MAPGRTTVSRYQRQGAGRTSGSPHPDRDILLSRDARSGPCDHRRMALSEARIAARLPASDLERARRWYAEKLALEPVEERPGGLRYVVGGAEFAVYQSAGRADGSFTQLAFTVADIEAEVAALRPMESSSRTTTSQVWRRLTA